MKKSTTKQTPTNHNNKQTPTIPINHQKPKNNTPKIHIPHTTTNNKKNTKRKKTTKQYNK